MTEAVSAQRTKVVLTTLVVIAAAVGLAGAGADELSPQKATPSASPSVAATVASQAHSRAQRLLYAGRIDSAVSAWEQGLASSPEDVESLAALGATLYANGEPARAAVFLERAVAKARDDWPLRILHATTLELSGQRERAEREFDAIAADSSNAMIRDIARALRERKSLFRGPTAIAPEVAAKLGIAAIPGQTWIGVLQDVAWGSTPSGADGGTVAASATQLELTRWAGAKELAPALAPGRALASARSPHHVGGLFTVYFGQSAMVTTFSYAQHRSLTVFRAWKDSAQEGNPAALRQVANIFAFIADTVRAAGLRKAEDKMVIATVMGSVRADEGNLSEAEQFYRYALARLPNNPQARTLLGGVYLAMANLDAGPVQNPKQSERYRTHLRQAESELEAALKQWPEYSKALLNLGLVRDLQGRRDEAIALAERAAILRPSLWEAYGNLACTYKEAGRAILAREVFEHLQETAPDQSQRFLKCVEGLPPAK